MSKVKIYVIVNPLTEKVFYVGASVNPKKRFYNHKHGHEWHEVTYRYKQIQLLKEAGVEPVMLIVDECDLSSVRQMEEHYISHFKSLGHKLDQNARSAYRMDGYATYRTELNRKKQLTNG